MLQPNPANRPTAAQLLAELRRRFHQNNK